jgi:hypothetical protein
MGIKTGKVHSNSIVFLDTNIWLEERMLKSARGAAFLYTIRRIGGKIGLPNVIELEIINKISREGLKAVENIKSGFTTIQVLLGTKPDYKFPTIDDFEEKAKERIAELDNLIIKSNISLAQYESALDRVIQETPPNKTREQFRDTLLWEVILDTQSKSKAVFITKDQDFYEEGNYKLGLAEELHEDISTNLDFKIFNSLEAYIIANKEIVSPLNFDSLANEISKIVYEELDKYAINQNLSLSSLSEYAMEAFLTERNDELAITYELRYNAKYIYGYEEKSDELRFVVVVGQCFYNSMTRNISDSSLDKIECQNESRQRIQDIRSIHYLRAKSITVGPDMIPYSVRKKL